MKQPVPTLYGPVNSPLVALNTILSYYFKTLKSQSVLHYHQTYSLIYDIKSAGSLDSIEDRVQDSINALLEPYFDSYQVTVSCSPDEEHSDSYSMKLFFRLNDNGREINVGQLMDIKNNRLARVQAISKLGDI